MQHTHTHSQHTHAQHTHILRYSMATHVPLSPPFPSPHACTHLTNVLGAVCYLTHVLPV